MMTTLESIAAAIDQIDEKKEKLKKAFDDLQAHRSLLSPSFNLSWSEIDSHFSSLQASLCNRFRLLHPVATYSGSGENTLNWPELRTFCENMDGNGLGKFMIDNSKKRLLMNQELTSAIRCASNPAALVLDAIQGSYHCSPSSSSANQNEVRRIFVMLLEALIEIKPNLTNVLRERARTLAYDWKKNIANKPSEALGFLNLVAVFELGSLFNVEVLVDYVFLICTYKQATLICKKIGLDRKIIRNLIQKFLDSGRFIAAIRFVYEYDMTGEFQPVLILKTSLRNAREAAKRVCVDGNYSVKALREAADKELSALRAVIKVVNEKSLKSEFVQEKLEECVQELENQKAERRCATKSATPGNPQKQRKKVNNKRPRVAGDGTTKSATPGNPQKPQKQVNNKRPRVADDGTTKSANPGNPQKPQKEVNNNLPRVADGETTKSATSGKPQKLQKQVNNNRPRLADDETTKSATPGNPQKPQKQVNNNHPRVADDGTTKSVTPGNPQKPQKQVNNNHPRVADDETTKSATSGKPQKPQKQVDNKRTRVADDDETTNYIPMPKIPQQPLLLDPNYNSQVNPVPPVPQQPVLPDPNYNLQENPFGLLNSTQPGVGVPYGNPFASNQLAALLYGLAQASVPAQAPQPVYYNQQNGYGWPAQYQPPYNPR